MMQAEEQAHGSIPRPGVPRAMAMITRRNPAARLQDATVSGWPQAAGGFGGAGWLAHTWSLLRRTLDDAGHSPPRKSQKVV